MKRYPTIKGWGKYLPEKVLTNYDLQKKLDTSDAWIYSRTGIRERRIAADEETASTMGAKAGELALKIAGIEPQELDLIIVASCTADKIFPACASLIQNQLGAKRAGAFDINAACSSFLPALATACQFIQGGTFNNILVVGTEVYSRIIDWQDRNTCILFGDGAGAVVLQGTERSMRLPSFVIGSDGSKADLLYVPGVCDAISNRPADGHYYLRMDGHAVFKFAVQCMSKATLQAIEAAGLSPEDIDLFIPHQANRRIMNAIAKAVGIPQEKVFINVDRYGNTSAASIPIALCEALEEERLAEGSYFALAAFGGGFSWGAGVLQWSLG